MARYTPLVGQDQAHTLNTKNEPLPIWKLESKSETWPSSRDGFKQRLVSVLPRFAQPGGIQHRKLGPTSYLDALRGWAAVGIFWAHSFNVGGDNWRRQPFLNVIFNGASMVALFFVISGYVLGYRLLIFMRKAESEALLTSLASSTFRRYIRLYGSAACACLIAMVLMRLRIYEGCYPPDSIRKETLWQQFVDYTFDMIYFTNPFGHIRGWPSDDIATSRYLSPMWSIAAEYRGSVALFAFCTAVCKMSTKTRMISTWVVMVVCYIWQAVYIAEFMAGLFIADLALSRSPERLESPWTIPKQHPDGQKRRSKAKHICIFLVGLFLLSQPDTFNLFPWNHMAGAIPCWWNPDGKYLFWYGFGAFALVYSLEFFPALQKPLHWRLSQYLGDISFGLYAMHGPFLLGPYMQVMIPLREQYMGNSVLKYIPGFIIYPLMVLIAADYFERIDKTVVRLARCLQGIMFS